MKLARFFSVLFHSPSSVTCWPLLVALFLAPGAGWAAGSPAHPGDSSAAPFGARQVPGDPEGTAILNVDSGMSYPTIQDAVDAASPGDVLEVTVPDHVEGQVLVDKDLTLRSQQTSEGGPPAVNTVRMGVDTGSSGDDRGWFLVDTGVDLQVLNLAFDGDGRLVYQGFRHKGTGRFENVHFDDVQYNASGPDFAGLAIVAFGGNVDVVGCSFANVGRVGVLAFGAGLTDSSIVDSVYAGKGDGTFLDYAADVSAGAVVTLAGNKVSDCRGVATDGSTSAGFLVTTFFGAGTTAEVTANDVTTSTTGVAVGFDADSSAVTASFNRLVGNTDSGLDGSSSTPVAAENNWWGCNAGPADAACDPVTGTGTVDFDPWLVLGLAADPSVVPAAGNSLLTADLAANSDGADVSGLGSVIDGCISADFDPGPLGTVDPTVVTFEGGTAETLFTAGTTAGVDVVSVTVDGQTVETPIEVQPGGIEIPTLGGFGAALLAALLAAVGAALLGRRRR